MKLYVCWGTFQTVRPAGHPCADAHRALQRAGHDPEVVKVHGLGVRLSRSSKLSLTSAAARAGPAPARQPFRNRAY